MGGGDETRHKVGDVDVLVSVVPVEGRDPGGIFGLDLGLSHVADSRRRDERGRRVEVGDEESRRIHVVVLVIVIVVVIVDQRSSKVLGPRFDVAV